MPYIRYFCVIIQKQDIPATTFFMTQLYTRTLSDMSDSLAKPLRTKGCIIMICVSGCAILECNFTRKAFRRGYMAVIFSDTLVSVEKVSAGFSVMKFELSASLTDEVTYISSGPFFDWLSENQVLAVPDDLTRNLWLWADALKWIDRNADDSYKDAMRRNHWQNFFLGMESAAKPLLEATGVRTISSARRLFNKFCQLLCENCRTSHNVGFYADRLCVTPYYLSKITYRIFQVSPKELIDRQLIMEIKAILTTTDLTVKEIAHHFNFESASYLGRYFRRHTGMTPLGYRTRLRHIPGHAD